MLFYWSNFISWVGLTKLFESFKHLTIQFIASLVIPQHDAFSFTVLNMLQDIRDRATGWVAWVIVILIVIPFAFFGLDQYLTGGSDRYAAKVNDVEIPLRDYRGILQQQKQRMRSVLRDRYDSTIFDSLVYKTTLIDRIVDEEILAQMTQAERYQVSDVILSQQIRGNPAFSGEHGFDQELYERRLSLQGESIGSYEQNLRRTMVVNQFQTGLTNTVLVTSDEINRLIKLDRQEREIEVITLKSASFTEVAGISSDQVAQYYRDHSQAYVNPEKVKLEYIEFSVDSLAKGLQVDEAAVIQYYQENTDRFNQAEQRQAAHILVAVDVDASEGLVKEARAKVMDLRLQLDQGGDFVQLAKDNSDDSGSSLSGGALGVVTKGMMGDEFDRVLFDLEEGEVSDPVRTDFGWHLVKVVSIEQGAAKPFSEVRDDVLTDYRQREAEGLFYDKSEKLADLAYENPDNLEVASEALDLATQFSGFITRGVTPSNQTGLSHPKAMAAAFSEEVLLEGNNSDLIELDDTHVMVLRVSERIESTPQSLADVEAVIRQQLAVEAAQALMQSKAEVLRDAYASGATPELTEGMSKSAASWVRRGDVSPAVEVVQSAFALSKPLAGQAKAGIVSLSNGDVAVLVLKSVKDGKTDGISEELREVYVSRLRNVAGDADLNASLRRLRSDAEVEIIKANL